MRLYKHSMLAVAALMASPSLICCASDGADEPAGGGGATPAPPADPKTDAKPAKKVKSAHVVWCAPGHHTFGIGVMVRTDVDSADALRNAGNARLATDDEVAEAKKAGREVHDLV